MVLRRPSRFDRLGADRAFLPGVPISFLTTDGSPPAACSERNQGSFVHVVGADPPAAGPPLLSLLYGPCRYGTRTSQKALKPLRRLGCGPCSRGNDSDMRSPTGLFGSPVYLKTWTQSTIPA